jgi:hypothetical protein
VLQSLQVSVLKSQKRTRSLVRLVTGTHV